MLRTTSEHAVQWASTFVSDSGLWAGATCGGRDDGLRGHPVVQGTWDHAQLDEVQQHRSVPCNLKSPGEIKRREVSWTLTKKLAQKRSRAGRWCWARERVGLLLFWLFPNGRAIDIVFMTLFCIEVGTAIVWCGGRCAMPDGHCLNILLLWQRSMAALVFRVGTCFEISLFCTLFPTRPHP